MKLPINCPVCHDPLLNQDKFGKQWLKVCNKRLNHKIMIVYEYTNDVILNMAVSDGKDIIYRFYPSSKSIHIIKNVKFDELWRTKEKPTDNRIPYFEPDFSNFNKLINKLKTYTLLI